MKPIVLAMLLFSAMAPYAAAADAAKPKPWLGFGFVWRVNAARQPFLHVERVVPGGPADRAGLRPGDIITNFGRTPVGFGDELDLLLFLGDRKPKDRLTLGTIRAGQQRTVVIEVGTMPAASYAAWERALGAARARRAAAARRK